VDIVGDILPPVKGTFAGCDSVAISIFIGTLLAVLFGRLILLLLPL
jgi:hypothetical protein